MSGYLNLLEFVQNIDTILEKNNFPNDNYRLSLTFVALDLDEIDLDIRHRSKNIFVMRQSEQGLSIDGLGKDVLALADTFELRTKRIGLTLAVSHRNFLELAKRNPEYHEGESIRKIVGDKEFMWFVQIFGSGRLDIPSPP